MAGVALRAWSGSNDAQRGLRRHFASKWSPPAPARSLVWAHARRQIRYGHFVGYPLRYPSASTAAHARAMTARSQFWPQLSPFVGVPECSTARSEGVKPKTADSSEPRFADLESGWVQALAGSNPASSATPGSAEQVVTRLSSLQRFSTRRPASDSDWGRTAAASQARAVGAVDALISPVRPPTRELFSASIRPARRTPARAPPHRGGSRTRSARRT